MFIAQPTIKEERTKERKKEKKHQFDVFTSARLAEGAVRQAMQALSG